MKVLRESNVSQYTKESKQTENLPTKTPGELPNANVSQYLNGAKLEEMQTAGAYAKEAEKWAAEAAQSAASADNSKTLAQHFYEETLAQGNRAELEADRAEREADRAEAAAGEGSGSAEEAKLWAQKSQEYANISIQSASEATTQASVATSQANVAINKAAAAQQSAQSAATSASNAEDSARDAYNSAQESAANAAQTTGQAEIAAQKAKEAAASAAAAKVSEDNASDSVDLAREQATIATDEANKSADSAADSARSAAAAKVSEDNAFSSETDAAASKDSASASATTASNAASSANDSKVKAKASEVAAKSSENAAAASATESARSAAESDSSAAASQASSAASETSRIASETARDEAVASRNSASASAATATEQAVIASTKAEASAISADQSAASATKSESSSVKSEEFAKKSEEIYEAFAKGAVYRGGWNPNSEAYPDHLGVNSYWDVYLNEGQIEYSWGGITWHPGDRLIYSVPDTQYYHINRVSGVMSVNGKTGDVVLTADNVGAVSKAGDTMTGTLNLQVDIETSNILTLSKTRPWSFQTAGDEGVIGLRLVSSVDDKKFLIGGNDVNNPSLEVYCDGTQTSQQYVAMRKPRSLEGQEGLANSLTRKDYVNSEDRFILQKSKEYADAEDAKTLADAKAYSDSQTSESAAGKVSKTGDTMTGQLQGTSIKMSGSIESRALVMSYNGTQGPELCPKSGSTVLWEDRLHFNDGQWRIRGAQIYTTAYNPTAANVGAVAKSGDTMTGELRINATNGGLTLQGTNNAIYLYAKDSSDVQNWFVGKGSVNSNNITLHSYQHNRGMTIHSNGFDFANPAGSTVTIHNTGITHSGGKFTNYGRPDNASIISNSFSFIGGPKDVHMMANAYWDGAWKKFDNSKASGVLVMIPDQHNSMPILLHSNAGSSDTHQHVYKMYHEGNVPTSDDIGALPSDGKAANSFKSDYLTAHDVRSVKPNSTGISSGVNGVKAYFVNDGNVNVGSGYSDLLILDTYGDSSGGKPNALAFKKSTKAIYHLQPSFGGDSWGAADKIYTTAQKPTCNEIGAVAKTGSDMSGGINFSGISNPDQYTSVRLPEYARGSKTYLRKFRGGVSDTIWHETVTDSRWKLSTGVTDAYTVLEAVSGSGLHVNGSVESGTGYFSSVSDSNSHYWFKKTNGTEQGVFWAEPTSKSLRFRNSMDDARTWIMGPDGTFESTPYVGTKAYAQQHTTKAPFYVNHGAASSGQYYPTIKWRIAPASGAHYVASLGTTTTNNGAENITIHSINTNGTNSKQWVFNSISGDFFIPHNAKYRLDGGYATSFGRADNISVLGSQYSFFGGASDAHLMNNVYWDGSWKKFNNAIASGMIRMANGDEECEPHFIRSWQNDSDPHKYSYKMLHKGNYYGARTFKKDIEVGGDANTYYLVRISTGVSQSQKCRLQIQRDYSEKAPDSWNSATHRGSLTACFLMNAGGWGGTNYDWTTEYFTEVYSTMMSGAAISATGSYFLVWLRGGGAVYHIMCDSMRGLTTSVELGNWSDQDGTVYSPKTTRNNDTVLERFSVRWGNLYDNNERVFSPNNLPTSIGYQGVSINPSTNNEINFSISHSNALFLNYRKIGSNSIERIILGNNDTSGTRGVLQLRNLELVNGSLIRHNHATGGLIGSYNTVGDNHQKSNPIYCIGTNYQPLDNALQNMYGIGFTHTGFPGIQSVHKEGGGGWGLYGTSAGTNRWFLNSDNGSFNGYHIYLNGASSSRKSARLTSSPTSGGWNLDKTAFLDLGGASTSGSTATYSIRYKNTAGTRIFALEHLDQSGTTYMRVGSGGNFFFDINGDFSTGGKITAGGNMVINNGSPTLYLQDTDGRGAFLHNNSNTCYILRGSGNNTPDWDSGPNNRHPMVMNLISGDVTFSGNVTAYSDERLKTNIKTIDSALDKVQKIRGVTYNWKNDEAGVGEQVGVIAQEVQKVLPQVVSEQEDGNLTVAYSNMVGLLIESIKELKAEVDSLKTELEEVKRG